ncbi:hypothetical protein DRE43_27155 [Salmonella enterica subsp. enterica serovar Java]|uniref:NgrC n=1 Tax=Salmonella enterica TaxID=28901 RepID=A0A403N3A5_SALER|nr:hypothetical protein [Salmonella enterica subsp. diarizonae]EAU1517748.1 hypothetical protein [Salmonella enterica]EBQ9441481.1 hypothetical protein [Salmonella enterica subsp. enterica serovar Cerro]EBX2068240.1 hypothetical protein [Salmonella enterica subsp. enterica serovar Java]EDO1589048.1 hypothetical protein [Salmonella enterica subsp. enterica serovar Adelaide]EDW6119631.1 hypothetical protein [Salmonella enterica subsp. salamae]EHE8610527.1 hypothetical protein [Salmonella enteri
MNTMTELVTLNCRRLAVAWGYPDDLQTHWSLEYCQGDGVCYSGRITPPEIPRLVDGMKARGRLDERGARILKRLAAANRLDITLRHSGRYTHSGCTDIITDDVPGYAQGLSEMFETALREDLDCLCYEAASEGESLLDARWPYPYCRDDNRGTLLFCRRTGYLTVQAEITSDDGAEDLFIDDGLAYECLILPALQQNLRFPQVKLSVTVTETGEELASLYCDLFFRSAEPLRRTFSGIRHELKTLFAEARRSLAERRQIYHDIRLAV